MGSSAVKTQENVKDLTVLSSSHCGYSIIYSTIILS